MNSDSKFLGTVKFYNVTKGWGFISQDNSDKEYFVHYSKLVDKVAQNDRVVFELEEGKKGLQAVNVQKV